MLMYLYNPGAVNTVEVVEMSKLGLHITYLY
jgi:hypothetical protein